ncbi:MAG TPA: WecB/TagA/CpsF family glycosyltransferase [Dehalococcoidia bacterium]|jgi:N-acetylglucosaminyldiphosphoundecaprenol N-acetyl-beta-D-mannosaminyltransferase|nr:WecB/TagA/CpsF family glycosyltransferase [Dehalococcoidia bacterium]
MAMTHTAASLPLDRYPQLALGGIRIDAIESAGVDDLLRPLLRRPGPHHVITVNANYLRSAASNPRLQQVIEDASLVVPDGMPLVWAMKLRGARVGRRITGHDLTESLIRLSVSEGISLFFLGAAPGVAAEAAARVRRRHPAVSIAGVYSPPESAYPFPAGENERMISAINTSAADAVLVALGCPKQDLWLADNKHALNASLAVGVGCVLDVLAGGVSRAPGWVQSAGVEWLYRLYQEPRRLATRYARDAAFLSRVFVRGALEASRPGR